MKILVALHQCMDLGGIINHTEELIGGLKDLGHEVHFKELVWAIRANDVRKEGEFVTGPSGIPHHQGKGWRFSARDRIAYRGPAMLAGAKQILQRYDMIIWTVPVPSKNKGNLGNNEWPELYDLPDRIRQVAFMHDGNAQKGNSHILAIQDRLHGLACVHPCALNGSVFVDVPRALVVNPQQNPVRSVYSWQDKLPGFVNMQTFKAWKHAHELIGAIRFMPKKVGPELREVAGKGIEYQYLTSEDKCKDAYFHEDGERFWDAALDNGMTHHDYWDVDEVDMYLKQARVLVDPSWSNNYSKVGGHFNRVVVEAMMRGCIPVARRMGMGDEVFKAGQHYIEIPQDASLEEYAETVIGASHLHSSTANEMLQEQKLLLPMFDRKTVAQRLIDLAHGDLETEEVQGEITPKLQEKVEDLLFNHFGVLL